MRDLLAPADGPAAIKKSGSALLETLGRLREEMGGTADAPVAARASLEPVDPPLGRLDRGDEQLVQALRRELLSLAGPWLAEGGARTPSAVKDALDGVEYVVRGDLGSGRAVRLGERLPSFVFLVLLPLLGRPEAIRVAARAERLRNS